MSARSYDEEAGLARVQAHQAGAALASVLTAVIPTMPRQDIRVTAPEGATEPAIAVVMTTEEARQLTALLQVAQVGAGTGNCSVCGCPMANIRCGHTCCCSGGPR